MKNIKKTVSGLSGIDKKKNPFKVPANYFENFSIRLSDRLREKVSPRTEKKLMPALKPLFAVVSVAAILIITGILLLHSGRNTRRPLTAGEITANVESNIYYYDEETIIDVLYPSAELSEGDINLTEEELIEYLINDDITINDIMNAI